MAGTGPPPKADRRRANAPARGEIKPPPASVGWQHGDAPAPPSRLTKAAIATWSTWFDAWFAAHWAPEDLPNLGLIIKLWARADRGSATAAERSELRQLMDSYGITLKGQQDRRWTAPAPDKPVAPGTQGDDGPYAGLRVVG